jgi:hypothetical protein
MSNKTILYIQQALIKNKDNIMSCNIHETSLEINNISISTFPTLEFITNDTKYNNAFLYLSKICVYINNNIFETEIFGLYEIIKNTICNSDSDAYNNGEKTFFAFQQSATDTTTKFKNNETIHTILKKLTELSDETPDISDTNNNITFKITLSLEPTVSNNVDIKNNSLIQKYGV